MSSHILLHRTFRCLSLSHSSHIKKLVAGRNAVCSRTFQPPLSATFLSHRYSTSANSASSRKPANYYELLGISRDASSSEVKKAYYQLAKNHHPDTAGGDPELFAQVNEAYETLSDTNKRRIYDRYGEEGVRAAAMGTDPSAAGMGGMGDFGAQNIDDVLRDFSEFFSNQSVRRRAVDDPIPGEDKQTVVTLTLREAAFGATKEVRTNSMEVCSDCAGSGKTAHTRIRQCPQCSGEGRIRRSGGMFQTMIMSCHRCSGTGNLLENPCSSCEGDGVVSAMKESSVTFPPGCDTGMVLRVPGGGATGVRRGPPGDLFIQVRVKEDEYFHRDGRDLHVVAPISIAQAALGGTVEVRTIDGADSVPVRPGTQPDDSYVLHGRALRGVNSPKRGNQIIHFKVVVPETLSDHQRNLLTKLSELEGGTIKNPEECTSHGLLQRFQRFLRRTVGANN